MRLSVLVHKVSDFMYIGQVAAKMSAAVLGETCMCLKALQLSSNQNMVIISNQKGCYQLNELIIEGRGRRSGQQCKVATELLQFYQRCNVVPIGASTLVKHLYQLAHHWIFLDICQSNLLGYYKVSRLDFNAVFLSLYQS